MGGAALIMDRPPFYYPKCLHEVRTECSASVISKYRFLWLNLSELLQSLGNAYARTYSTLCIFICKKTS
ncbi:hypothetical protein FF38_05542 [Lucilia cuprina]|uniref:Uncharacterized protein n=1 Tax=Lucilia cuprina TaxID=7375 RepID=A0A0L0C7R0_LUCCU|nr:hypothetical protein FF38_05542 [Lucilia cuprina]